MAKLTRSGSRRSRIGCMSTICMPRSCTCWAWTIPGLHSATAAAISGSPTWQGTWSRKSWRELHAAADSAGDGAATGDRVEELREIERLVAVGEGPFGVGMDLKNQAVSAGGDGGNGHVGH